MAIKRAIKAGNKSIISFKKAIKVGEITQWFDKDKFSPSQTDRTLTFTNNGDGSVTVSGVVVNTARAIYGISDLKELVKGHKYLLSGCPSSNDDHFLSLNVYNNDGKLLAMYLDGGSGSIFTFDQEYYARHIGGIYIYERQVGAEINRTYTPQLFDLTEMFGAGHEPATVAEFKAKFPEAYYPYQRAVLTVYNKVVRPCARKGEVVQLLDKSTFPATYTKDGITFTNNGDGTITVNGTATAVAAYVPISDFRMVLGHKYLLVGCPSGGSWANGYVQSIHQTDSNGKKEYWADDGEGKIFTSVATSGLWVLAVYTTNPTVDNKLFKPNLFDLTAMYGAGNEPKTLADFRKDFPESYYPYNPVQTKNLLKMVINSDQYRVISTISGDVWTIIPQQAGGYGQLKTHLPAGTYTLSGVICNNNEFSTRINYTILSEEPNAGNIFASGYLQNNLTFTLDKEKDFYILLYPAAGINESLGVYRKAWYKLQIEKGSVATDYVPHDYI